ncbi:MAG: transcription-repair coupling factor [Planctomycetota bacterium]|nr:MAG: transcription-repair coupling factor [Planctomycetota bacterium]
MPIQSLSELVDRLRRVDGFSAVTRSLQAGQSGTIDGAWGSSCALATATIAQAAPGPVLVVLPRIQDVDDFAADLLSLLPEPPMVFPTWESLPKDRSVADAVYGARLRLLQEMESGTSPQVIVASVAALLHPVPSRKMVLASTRTIRIGQTLETEEFLGWLVARGFERTPTIERAGEFSIHGGIIDIFTPEALDPVRIELFGDEVDSIRTFDVETQRKVDTLSETAITAIGSGAGLPAPQEKSAWANGSVQQVESLPLSLDDGECLVDRLAPGSWVVLSELIDLVEEGKHYLQRLDNPRGLYRVEQVLARTTQRPSVTLSALMGASAETTCHLKVESLERLTGPKSEVLRELAGIVGRDEQVVIACHNEGERQRMRELLDQSVPELVPRVSLVTGSITRGYRLVAEQIVVISDNELFDRVEVRRTAARKKRLESRAIDSFLDLKEGDLVVHLSHGIGRFRGMEVLDREGGREEHLVLEFRDGVKIYVPASLINLVQKYVGATKSSPTLSKVGGTAWASSKKKVAAAVADMASDMLRLQAQRELIPGVACPPDSRMQQEFEAAFPYTETDDQLRAIEDSKIDLEKPRPMDRLICGDVGFGKTEVAIRAAFKMVDAGRQVAILVPTTVLAEQHYRTFCNRLAEFPIEIEVLSRFRSKAEQKAILEKMEAGAVDVVIGTHRLVQPDVKFKDLGLLVIDEEQRFGVAHKEMLKRLRLAVDVLTLSATPIPRTLHLSLLGIRDISNLTTAPQDRMAIETRIVRWDADLIRQAVMRELNRGGQVYFVHTRVMDIESLADRIQSIVPEAKIAIVHGQMGEHELEQNMYEFVKGRADILIATTIIESGLDIPTANTMFINEADKYGLADLHQLRGRVGRHKNRAYCYLILDDKKSLTSVAARRLKAIEEFSELGAGFKIAMRDLEIRGAGNILGTEQSGHISTVGYELYCHLLENAVRRQKEMPERELPHVDIDLAVTAFLPNSFVPPGRQKIDVYRRLSVAATGQELTEVAGEIRDRFGPLPPEVEQLVEVKELQLYAFAWGISAIRMEEGRFAVLSYKDDKQIRALQRQIGNNLRMVDKGVAYLLMPVMDLSGPETIRHLKSVLKP